MKQKIYTKKNKLIIEIPLIAKRYCPFEEKVIGDMDNVIALIENENDMGFCYSIDMGYKGKPDQWTDYFFKWFGEKKEFEQLCKKLKIGIIY